MKQKYFIVTFGCAANVADSERIAAVYESRGFSLAKSVETADVVIINTCMVRQSAENRVYGLINNLSQLPRKPKIILTGCMAGMAIKEKSGKQLKRLKEILPGVDEFLPIEEVGYETMPLRQDKHRAIVPISTGCNNFCSYCVVPYARGREVSRKPEDIINECKQAAEKGYGEIMLVGQNVNSYGNDLVNSKFSYLLNEIAKIKGLEKIEFMSSNPWDFSEELIKVISKNKNISRVIHLPVQSGDDEILKKMNRNYTVRQYLSLIKKIRKSVDNVQFTTDIIVGFPGETDKQFKNTVKLCQKVGFIKAYISKYSDRPLTLCHKTMADDVSNSEKKRRWLILDNMI